MIYTYIHNMFVVVVIVLSWIHMFPKKDLLSQWEKYGGVCAIGNALVEPAPLF